MASIFFTYTTSGLEVSFKAKVPGGSNILWDFGDNTSSTELEPVHSYEKAGVYTVTLKTYQETPEAVLDSYSDHLLVSDIVKTHLSESIYELIKLYIPTDIFGEVPEKTLRVFIEKWQLYIQPLAEHNIPIEEVFNEAYYEALENQLIVEAAAYDYMVVDVSRLYRQIAASINSRQSTVSESGEDTGESGDIKHITTGPTEVEYFNQNEYDHDYISTLNKALAPGGFIDTLRQTLCMLAQRVNIWLPICGNPPSIPQLPKVKNHRIPRGLDGPDPIPTVTR